MATNLNRWEAGVGQWTQVDGVGNTEDDGGGADAECEGEDHGSAEDRRAAYGAQGVFEILTQAGKPAGAPGIAGLLGDQSAAAEAVMRLKGRLLGVQAIGLQPCGFEIDVGLKFLGQFCLAFTSTENTPHNFTP